MDRKIDQESCSDRELLSKISSGNEEALESLMLRYSASMIRLGVAIVGSRDIAMEVVQDVFIWLWRQGKGIDIPENLEAYLWRAVRNRASNILRYEDVRLRTNSSLQPGIHYPVVAHNDGALDIEVEDLLVNFYQILSNVPPRCREIFFLHWRDGMSVEDIAQGFGISFRTVQNQLALAGRYLLDHWSGSSD